MSFYHVSFRESTADSANAVNVNILFHEDIDQWLYCHKFGLCLVSGHACVRPYMTPVEPYTCLSAYKT